MINRRAGLLLLIVIGLAAYATQSLWRPVEVRFTHSAPAALPTFELRANLSTVFLTIPVDLAGVAQRIEAALGQRLAMAVGGAEPACARPRAPIGDCAVPRLDGPISRAGPVEVGGHGPVVRIRVPLRIEPGLAAAAAGGAPQKDERYSDSRSLEQPRSELTLVFGFRARLVKGEVFAIAREGEAAVEGAEAAVAARLARQLEIRLKPVMLAAHDELRQALAVVPLAAARRRAWYALSQPIELGRESGVWLNATAEAIGGGELDTSEGKTIVRIPIAARLAIGEADRSAMLAKRNMVVGTVNSTGGAAIRMAFPVGLGSLQAAVDRAFVDSGVVETRADRFGPPVQVSVYRTRVYPSARYLAVELDLAATRFEGQTFHGKAHLIGRPVVQPATGTVTLAEIMFPPAPREALAPKAVPGAPRISAEPLAALLRTAARLDVSREIADAVPYAMSLLHQRIDDRLALSARLGSSAPVSIEMSSKGAWLVTDVAGELTLNYDGPPEAQPSEDARQDTPPDIDPAAVISPAGLPSTRTAGSAMPDPGTDSIETQPPVNASPESKRPRKARVRANAPVSSANRDWIPFGAN